MPFPWPRYLRRLGVLFVLCLAASLLLAAGLNNGRIGSDAALVAIIDSIVLSIVAAFPLTQRIYRGPRR